MKIATIDGVQQAVLPLMGRFPAPWCIAGGWAIDLFLDQVTRSHDDVELAVFRQDQLSLHRHLGGWRFEKIVDGRRIGWGNGEYLELPVHEIHARPADGSTAAVEFLLNERDANHWVYRRNPSIRMPIEHAIVRSKAGLPILAPEIVLLFKSKSPREKDAADLKSASPALHSTRRRWLTQAVGAAEPGHPWLELLAAIPGNDA